MPNAKHEVVITDAVIETVETWVEGMPEYLKTIEGAKLFLEDIFRQIENVIDENKDKDEVVVTEAMIEIGREAISMWDCEPIFDSALKDVFLTMHSRLPVQKAAVVVSQAHYCTLRTQRIGVGNAL